MAGDDLVETAFCPDPEGRGHEGGDRVAGHRRHVGERDRPHAARGAEQATSERRQVRRIVGEPQVHALADRQQRPAATLASEEPIARVRVLRGLRDVGLNPEERPLEARVRLVAEELAVEVDADLEPRVAGHHLNGGRAAQRVTDDPDVLQVEMPGER